MDIAELKAHWEQYASISVVMQEVMADNANQEKMEFLAACAKDEAEHLARKG